MRRFPILAFLIFPATAGCFGDEAHRAYIEALRGDEDGATQEERMALLDRAIELAPERAAYYESRAILEIDTRNFVGARRDLDRAIELGNRPYLRFLRGLLACQLGEFAASLADFDVAIEGLPENGQFYRGRSLARSKVGLRSAALADAERLVALEPQVGTSYYARGIALLAFSRFEAAIADFTKAIELRPEAVYSYLARADAYQRTGQTARAEADRETAAQLAEEHQGCAPCLDPFRY